jgi:hypothetical protein
LVVLNEYGRRIVRIEQKDRGFGVMEKTEVTNSIKWKIAKLEA